MKDSIIWLFLIALAVGGEAHAGEPPQPYFGLSAGGHLVLTDIDLGEFNAFSEPSPIDSSAYFEARLGVDINPRWSVEAGLGYLPFDASAETNDGLDLAARVRWAPTDLGAQPYLTIGGGAYVNLQPDPDGASAAFAAQGHYGIGAGPKVLDRVRLRVEVRHQLTDGIGDDIGMALVAVAGLDVLPAAGVPAPPPPPPDRDGDGIPDAQDACPEQPSDLPDGCPAPPVDRDGDGVPDGRDACPDQLGDPPDGCPAPPPDRDGDGVADERDTCPDQRGAEPDGCPAPPPDRDGDGISDDVDACPDAAGAAPGGCPPEPAPTAARVDCDRIEVGDAVLFDSGRYRLLPAADPVIEAVAAALEQHPEIRRVRIAGFTDSTGSAEQNARLSLQRAWVVRQALVARGVDRTRVIAVGLGARRPRSSNTTAQGRRQNRRVEFTITSAGARPGCPTKRD